MIWCITTLAVLALILAMTMLALPMRNLRLPRIRPARLLRGCAAATFLVVAVSLGLLAWSLAQL